MIPRAGWGRGGQARTVPHSWIVQLDHMPTVLVKQWLRQKYVKIWHKCWSGQIKQSVRQEQKLWGISHTIGLHTGQSLMELNIKAEDWRLLDTHGQRGEREEHSGNTCMSHGTNRQQWQSEVAAISHCILYLDYTCPHLIAPPSCTVRKEAEEDERALTLGADSAAYQF